MYQGEFTGKELDFLVEFACNTLMANGAFPFITADKLEASGMPFPDNNMEQ